jgi:hypothetical protein
VSAGRSPGGRQRRPGPGKHLPPGRLNSGPQERASGGGKATEEEDGYVQFIRAGARQEPAEDTTLEDRAVLDLATDVLGDLRSLGPAMILLAGRNCTPGVRYARGPIRCESAITGRSTNP